MISGLLHILQSALKYIQKHTELQFAFVLIVILPITFLYTSNQFLEAGRANQEKLQRDRIGILHDAFVSVLSANNFNSETVQYEISKIAELNQDLTKFRVVKQEGQKFVVIAALDTSLIGTNEENISVYQAAAVRFDESLIFPFYSNDVRFWQSVRSIYTDAGTYFILTENSFAAVDSYLESRENSAYMTLLFVYFILLALTYWLIKLTNYQALYDEAQNAIKTKDLFTNMIAHELRAPLTAIRGYASMIEDDKVVSDQIKTHADRIQTSSERLLAIVNDLLDVARIQSGKLSVELEEVNVTQVVLAVTQELAPSALEKNIALTTAGVGADHIAFSDTQRFHQALTNLVSNAIKYTKEGEIEISLEEKSRHIEVRVKDTGMGISAQDQKQLFAPFFRVSSGDVAAITGTGLGMWITRQLIELMGGTIGVESIKNVGTHVVVSLPKTAKANPRANS